MSYQALYRKYRPKDFSSVRGQEHIVKTLTNQIQADRIGHAYLFCGTRGTGKTTVAKIFAKAVNCENPGPNGPCGECAMCKAIEEQSSMNVVEIDAASNNRVDDIRQVIDEVQYSPAEGRFKVYIIDEVHMLSTSAFNALLKTLEEPPSYLIFILATTEAHKIPLTILSRCQRYDFKRIQVETIAARLRELLEIEGIEAEDKALTYIARQADGALRDGLSLLEQCISFYFGQKLTYENVLKILGAVDHSVYHRLMEALIKNQVDGVIAIVAEMVEQGKDLSQFVNELIWYLRNLLVVKTADEAEQLVDMSEENRQELSRFAEQIELEILFRYIRILSDLANDMKYANNKRVMLEMAMIRLCRPQSAGTSENKSVIKPQREIRPEAVPDDVRDVVANWNQILGRIDQVSRSMLLDVRISVSEAGKLVLAFTQGMPAEYFKKEENQQVLIEAAGQLTGKEISLDVRFVENRQEMNALPELRNIIKNVEIEMLD